MYNFPCVYATAASPRQHVNTSCAMLQDEIERGETTNAITCYMRGTGLSEEFAKKNVSKMIEECLMKMNKQLSSPSPFEENFIEVAMDLARIAFCQYQYGDAHSAPDVRAKNRIVSVMFDPIQLREAENDVKGGNNQRQFSDLFLVSFENLGTTEICLVCVRVCFNF